MATFLQDHKAKHILFVNHPLHEVVTPNETSIEDIAKKKVKKVIRRPNLSFPFAYLWDFFLTLKIGFSQKEPIDMFIGFNSMNTLPGIVLRRLGKVRRVITYSHSIKEKRFANPVLNILYQWIDRMAARGSDAVWGLSSVLATARKKQGIASTKIVSAPDGVDTKLVRAGAYTSTQRFRLVFLGLINEINGIELAVQALPALVAWNPAVTLTIIGEGELLPHIQMIVREGKTEGHVEWYPILPIEKVAAVLKKGGIGIATYKPLPDSTLKTTDPMKIKLYMAAGMPIISTDIYATAHEITDEKLGILIPYTKEAFVAAAKKLIPESTYKETRLRGPKFVKKYNWDHIYTEAFANTPF